MPSNLEVMALNPAEGWAFFLRLSIFSWLLYQSSVLNEVPLRGASLTVSCEGIKNGCLALPPGAEHAE